MIEKIEWVNCRVPKDMISVIDKFLQTELARKQGIYSRTDFIIRVIVAWFSNIDKDFRMFVPESIPLFQKTHPPPPPPPPARPADLTERSKPNEEYVKLADQIVSDEYKAAEFFRVFAEVLTYKDKKYDKIEELVNRLYGESLIRNERIQQQQLLDKEQKKEKESTTI
jgi:hypothetical protein